MKKMIVLLTVLLLTISGSAFAQLPEGFCGGLSEADCQIFTASTEAMAKLESASIDANLDLVVSNIPDAPFDSLAFNLKAEGAYHVEPGLLEKYMDMQANPAALFEDMEQLPQLMEDFFNGFDGQINLALTLPDELNEPMRLGGDTDIPETLAVDLMLVDGVAYINLSSLAESLPDAGIPTGWYGLEIAKLLGNVMEMSLSELEDMDMSGFDPSTFSQFYDPAFLESYLKIERLADSDGAAVFQMTIDMVALAENPAFRDLMEQQMEASGQTMSEADVEAALAMVAQMYEGLDMQATYSINLDDNTMRGMDMTLKWDMASLMDAVGESSTAAPVITMNLSATYSDYNAAPAITAPEDASVLTAEDAMQMFMGEMQTAPRR